MNSLCQNCDAKARVPADAFRAELAARRLDEVFGRSARSYAEHATHGPPADRPPAHLRRRVSGSDDEVVFDLTGIQAASRLMQYVVQYDRSAQPTLLDWGCGCGRAAQTILANLPNVRYTGTDIDREAIAWCAANLHGGSFVHQGIDPPLPFPDRHFTSVIGISVMTHLHPSDQVTWLHEIHRVLADGGICVLTVHGPTAASRGGADFEDRVRRHGIVADQIDDALDGVVERGYYRTVFQTEEFTRQLWPTVFEFKEFLEGGLGGHQDIVVLQKRPGDGNGDRRAADLPGKARED